MNVNAEMHSALQEHLGLCRQILSVVEQESQALQAGSSDGYLATYQSKHRLRGRLEESVERIKIGRKAWQVLPVSERGTDTDVGALLLQNQNQIMKIIVLDRENEHRLLRRGLVPPRHLPSPNRQRPHFVADLYRRQCMT